jgi:hypothetical protein
MAATRPDLRVGDAERESTATALREHYAVGRLSTDELNERLDAAFSATTHGQLEQVTHDLPHIQLAPAVPPPAVPSRRAGAAVARAVAALVTVVALLAVVSVALHGGAHVPRNIATLVIALLILRGLVGRAFGHQHHHHQHWDHRADADSSEDDDDRFDRSSPRRHEHHHDHQQSRSGHGYKYSYRYEYNYEHPRDSR